MSKVQLIRDTNKNYLERVGSPHCLTARKSLLLAPIEDNEDKVSIESPNLGYNTTRAANRQNFEDFESFSEDEA